MTDTPKQEVTQQLSPRAKTIKEVGEKLEYLLKEHSDAMPKDFNATRFLQNCLTVLRDTKDIEKCTPVSIARTLIKGAYLDLDFFRKECYAIPYGTELNFQTDYKGEIKVCKAFCPRQILDIYAKLVREGDVFEMTVKDGRQIINFSPVNFNDGKVLGAFAVVFYEDGGIIAEQMSAKEIDDIRTKFSKAPNSPAWAKTPGEMQKKVVLRRLTKMVNLKFPNVSAQEAYEEGAESTMDPNKKTIDVIADPFKEEALEHQGAAPVDADATLRAELKAKFPNEQDWQIQARIDDTKAAK